jgi:preprotein translocase subunit SecA
MFSRTAKAVESSANALSESRVAKALAKADSSELIPHIRALAKTLESASESQLMSEVGEVRRELARGHRPSEPHLLVAGIALAYEALRRSKGICLYDVQLIAAMAMSRRCIAQMQTGEGKTFVALTAAIHLAMAGRGVHVITPNTYLAERDERACGIRGGEAGIVGGVAA